MSKMQCFGLYEESNCSWHCFGCTDKEKCKQAQLQMFGQAQALNMKREYSDEVDKMRKHRVEVSFHKYGPASVNFGDHLVDAIKSHEMCVERYKETKNTEYLLDAMNYLMFEYMYPSVEGAYFKATDSSESAGKAGVSIKGV